MYLLFFYSFDYDSESVNCTKFLREKYYKNDTNHKTVLFDANKSYKEYIDEAKY